MAEPNLKMSTVDYIVVALFMLVTLVIGLFASWKSSKSMTSKDMVIHKGMSLPSVVLSLTATFLSAILLVGTPAEVYAYGIEWLVVCLGYILALPIAVFTAVQTLYPLEISSIFEYFQLRFGGRSVRSMAAFLYAAVMMFYSGTALYAPIIAIASITDVPEWAGILIAGSICTLYTAVGGVRAVIWVDSFQFLVMLGSAVALAGFGSSLVGGVHQVIQISKKFHRTNLFEFSTDAYMRHNFWLIVSNTALQWGFVFGANQMAFQRYKSLPTLRKAIAAVALNVPSMIMLTALACYCGLVVFANYAYCDPLLVDPSRKTDQIVPLFLVDKMRGFIGLPGLFIAGIFSGALSSVSSALNALAGIAWEDGLKLTVWGKKADESQKLVAIRLLGITFGIWAIFLAFICSVIGSTLLEINVTLNTTLCTPLIMMFFSSQFMPFVNKPGILFGAIASTLAASSLRMATLIDGVPPHPRLPTSTAGCKNFESHRPKTNNGSQDPGKAREKLRSGHPSYLLNMHIGLLVGFAVTVGISLLTGGWNQEIEDPSTLHYTVRQFANSRSRRKASMADEYDESFRSTTEHSSQDTSTEKSGNVKTFSSFRRKSMLDQMREMEKGLKSHRLSR